MKRTSRGGWSAGLGLLLVIPVTGLAHGQSSGVQAGSIRTVTVSPENRALPRTTNREPFMRHAEPVKGSPILSVPRLFRLCSPSATTCGSARSAPIASPTAH